MNFVQWNGGFDRSMRSHASSAPIPHDARRVPMTAILGIGGFDLARALEYKPTFLEPEYPFEWASAYALEARDLRIVLHEGPDPSMQALLCEALPADRLDPGSAAERVFALFSGAGESIDAARSWCSSAASWTREF